MAGGATKAGRVLLISVIGVIALAIAAFVIVLSINPPFQATEPTSSATATATPTRTATPMPSATPTTIPTATPTPEPTPSVIPTGDPVPTDDGFRATVTPILTDASTGLDIISESITAGSVADTKDVITQLSNDVQRLTDNTKPSDPDTWNGAVQTYAGGLRVLADAITRGDAAAGATAVENSRRDLASLTTLAAQ